MKKRNKNIISTSKPDTTGFEKNLKTYFLSQALPFRIDSFHMLLPFGSISGPCIIEIINEMGKRTTGIFIAIFFESSAGDI